MLLKELDTMYHQFDTFEQLRQKWGCGSDGNPNYRIINELKYEI